MITRTTQVSCTVATTFAVLLMGCAGEPQRSPRKVERQVVAVDGTAQTALQTPSEASLAAASSRSPVIVEGSGQTVSPPPSGAPPKSANADGFQLNFINTEISAIIATVLGDGLNLPYVIDPQIKGTMTLQATRPLSRDEVLAALEGALRTQGLSLVEANGTYRIVPGQDAPRRVGGLRLSADGVHGYGIYIVPLQFVSAAEMEKVLRPFAPEGGVLRVDQTRNLLLLAGSSQEIATLLSVVKTFDADWLAGMSFAMYPLDYVDAKTVANELGEIFGGANSPIAGVVRFVPLARLNSLMVVTPQAKYLGIVADWIKRLDLGSTTPGRRIYVYDVQNGKADDIADSLNHILSLRSERSDKTNGDANVRNVPASPTSERPSSAEPARQSEGSALDTNALKIVPSGENNSLLILASPGEFSIIEAALKRLDVLPLQILVEASIAEVTLTDDLKYGLQWSYQSGDGPIVLSDASNGSIAQKFPGFSYLYTARADIRGVLNAIEAMTNVRVISSPKLLVLNNRKAELQIGDQVPIATQSAVSIDTQNAPIVNSVQLRDTGVILKVTPRANKSGRVILEITQEVSDVVPTTTSDIDSPTIQQRKMSSTVAVANGETVALGGLIRDVSSRAKSGVPFLRRIPLLGDLFGSTNRNGARTELIVLIKPRVMRSEQESMEAMDDLREQFRGLRRLMPAAQTQLPVREVTTTSPDSQATDDPPPP